MSRSNSPVLATGWIDPRFLTHTGSWLSSNHEDTPWQMQNNNSAHDEQNLESSAYPTNPLLPEGVQRQNPYFLNEQNEQSSARTIHEGQSLLEQMGDPSESEDPWSRENVVDETGTRYEVLLPDALNPHHFQPLLPEGVQPQTPYFLNEQHEQPSARTIHEAQSLLPPYYDPYYDPPGSNYFLDETGTRRDAAISLLEAEAVPWFNSIQTPLVRLFGDDESSFAGLAPIRDPIEPSPTAKLLSAAPEEINDQLPSNLRLSSAHASITPFPSGELGQPAREELYKRSDHTRVPGPFRMEKCVDFVTTTDSGYHSESRNSRANRGEGNTIDNDTDSVTATSKLLSAAPGRNTDQLLSHSPLSNAHASTTPFLLGELEQPARDNLYKRFDHTRVPGPTGMGDCVDLVTATDSGYHSESRNSRANCGEGNIIDNDTDSVVTDGWPSSLPRQDKYMLEAEFAREIFNRSSAKTREQFVKRGQTVNDLLYSFSVMMWGRATSVAERGAASFVRHGRKYVPSVPGLHLRDCPYARTLIL
jgi:hypothetical protein